MHETLHLLRVLLPFIVIPPVGLIWLMLAALAARRGWPRLSRLTLGLSLFALYALATPVVSHALMDGVSATSFAVPPGLQPQAIVVLGGDGRRVEVADATAEPGALSLERLARAAPLARSTGLPVLFTGGGVGPGQPPVATLMAASFAKVFGETARWIEPQSLNTCENAKFSAKMLRQDNIEAAWVVTHAWHMPRALISFAHAGFPVVPVPVYNEHYETSDLLDFLPYASGWMRSYYALHEWIGIAAYRLGACPRA